MSGNSNRTTSTGSNIHRRSFQDQPPSSNQHTQQAVNSNNSGFLWSIMSFVQQLFDTQHVNTTDDSTKFISSFTNQYATNDEHHQIDFLTCSYRDAFARANRESKALLLYLHSPLHGS